MLNPARRTLARRVRSKDGPRKVRNARCVCG
jgi:hypothetical protein